MKFITATLVLALGYAVVPAMAASGFASSCSNYYIENNNFLRASCRNGAGGTTNSAINLNACIGISGNNLVCRPKYVHYPLSILCPRPFRDCV
jgi:CVNH domain